MRPKHPDYCKCDDVKKVYIDDDEWACWDVCAKCGKVIEDSITYYNHNDGEDSDEEY